MRVIKFRAWDKAGKIMLDWDKIKYLLDTPHFILMQFTGLEDKNGKEVFEGDIIQRYGGKYKNKQYLLGKPYVIKWCLGSRQNGWNIASAKDFEVIGNIYENKNLLKEKNE